jgi:hypothetical protein
MQQPVVPSSRWRRWWRIAGITSVVLAVGNLVSAGSYLLEYGFVALSEFALWWRVSASALFALFAYTDLTMSKRDRDGTDADDAGSTPPASSP